MSGENSRSKDWKEARRKRALELKELDLLPGRVRTYEARKAGDMSKMDTCPMKCYRCCKRKAEQHHLNNRGMYKSPHSTWVLKVATWVIYPKS